MKEIIRAGSGKRFFEPDKQAYSPSSDFDLCWSLIGLILLSRHKTKWETWYYIRWICRKQI